MTDDHNSPLPGRRTLLGLGTVGVFAGIAGATARPGPAHAADPVVSVNGKTGEVILGAGDVGAVANDEFRTAVTVASPARFPGLDPTGAAECAGAFQAALDAVAPGGTLFVPPGRYRLGAPLQVPANITISAPHRQAVLVRDGHTGIVLRAYGSHTAAITAASAPSRIEINENGQVTGGTQVTLRSAPSGWLSGDIVKIYADDVIPGSRRTGGSATVPRIGEYMRIHSVSGTTVRLNGWPFENYTSNVRLAKLDDKTVTIDGLSFDVSDSAYANTTPPECVLRCDSMRAPRLINVRVIRAVGIAIQMRSCAGYHIENAEIGHAIDNPSAGIFGYGIHDVASNGGLIIGGVARYVRHGYSDKSTEVAANGPYPSFYGRTLFPRVMGMQVIAASVGAFDTHQESYGVHFDNCLAQVTTSSGFSIRGSGHRITNCTVIGGSIALQVFTETSGGSGTGDTRHITVDDFRCQDSSTVVQCSIRESAHDQRGVQDTERTLTIKGLHARGARRLGRITNARVRISDYDVTAADLPEFAFIQNTNSQLDLVDGAIDFEGVTRVENNRNRILRSTVDAPSPGSRIYIRGMRVRASDFYASQCAVGPFETDATTDIDALVEMETPFPVMPGNLGASPRCTFGWSTWTRNDDSQASLSSSASTTFTNAALTGSLRAATRAPDESLLLLATLSDGISRQLGKLEKGRRLGQRLLILVARADRGATLTVRSGSAYGVTLTPDTSVALGSGDQLSLMWVGSSWRRLR
ncbi:hypothetical protein D8Y23_08185 [Microbacterium enclense]|uniref:Depolymerase 2 capsule K5-specific C-terminal domain-containing protein n=1 Tax=Microbacterium enclense TaxID=993073 RepID=A0A3S3LEP0_9MICO|nr:hypothetical protein [Microbacterium enclense]RWR19181.1 hypothetical protein D8Y23_08185 [Microbacterium enclense]